MFPGSTRSRKLKKAMSEVPAEKTMKAQSHPIQPASQPASQKAGKPASQSAS